jgi:hypothetical protein
MTCLLVRYIEGEGGDVAESVACPPIDPKVRGFKSLCQPKQVFHFSIHMFHIGSTKC